MDTAGLDAEYWYQSIRQTVQFERAVRSARDAGYRVFIESSPHPVLIAGIEETWPIATCGDAVVIPSLGRDDGGLDRFWLSAGQAHVAGVAVDWRSVFAGGSPGGVADVCVSAAAVLAAAVGCSVAVIWAVWGWPAPSTACWVRWWSGPIRAGWC